MRHDILIFSSLVLFSSLCTAQADTIIQSRDGHENGKTEISGQHIRAGAGEGYMLIDTESAHMYVVDTKRRVIRDFGSMPARTSMKLPGGAKLIGPTAGPTIAGYTTKVYRLEANGRTCGKYYLSRQALDIKDIRRFAVFFSDHKSPFEEMSMNFGGDPCAQADRAMDRQTLKLGVPMRETDAQGKVRHEVTAIKTGASIPASRMRLPTGYRHEDAAKQMNQAQKAMQQYQQQLQGEMQHMSPQQRQMLEQMMKQNH